MEAVDDVNGNRSIHIASQNGHLDIVKLLVSKKCDVNAQNKSGQTAMHMVSEYSHVCTPGARRWQRAPCAHR